MKKTQLTEMARVMFPEQENRDINNEKFWEDLHRSFELTIELLNEFAKAQGINLDEIDYALDDERKKNGARAGESPAAKAAMQYSAKVALIGIDRSIGARSELQKHFPEQDDSIRAFSFTSPG